MNPKHTLDYIYNVLGADRKAKSPIKIMRTRYGAIPKIIRNIQYKVGVEVGVATGYYSKHLCHYCPDFKLYSVDAWELFSGCTHNETQQDMDNLYEVARVKLAPFKNNQIIRAWSMDAVRRFDDNSLDFVYIDAAHDYKNAYQDIREWSKKVRPGGLVSGHDYQDPNFKNKKGYEKEIYDVKAAVNDWVAKENISPLFILRELKRDMSCPSWMYVKS